MDNSKMLDRLRRQCSRREYCTSDIMKKISAEEGLDTDAIVSALTSEGYLSDSRYAEAFARDKSSLDGWGPLKIRMALQAKGIAKPLVDAALAQVDMSAAASKLEKVVAARYRALSEDPQCRLKLLRFALGRGYGYEEAADAVDKAMNGSKDG